MGKRSAQAGNAVEAGGVRDQSRMAVTRHEARGNAREPDGGNAGTPRGWVTIFSMFFNGWLRRSENCKASCAKRSAVGEDTARRALTARQRRLRSRKK